MSFVSRSLHAPLNMVSKVQSPAWMLLRSPPSWTLFEISSSWWVIWPLLARSSAQNQTLWLFRAPRQPAPRPIKSLPESAMTISEFVCYETRTSISPQQLPLAELPKTAFTSCRTYIVRPPSQPWYILSAALCRRRASQLPRPLSRPISHISQLNQSSSVPSRFFSATLLPLRFPRASNIWNLSCTRTLLQKLRKKKSFCLSLPLTTYIGASTALPQTSNLQLHASKLSTDTQAPIASSFHPTAVHSSFLRSLPRHAQQRHRSTHRSMGCNADNRRESSSRSSWHRTGLDKSGRIVTFCDWKLRFCDQKIWCSHNFASKTRRPGASLRPD